MPGLSRSGANDVTAKAGDPDMDPRVKPAGARFSKPRFALAKKIWAILPPQPSCARAFKCNSRLDVPWQELWNAKRTIWAARQVSDDLIQAL